MDVKYSYCCRQDDSIIPEKRKGKYDGFFVDVRMCHKLRKIANGGSDADDNEVKLGTVRSIFTVNRSEFLAGERLRYLMDTWCLPLAYVPDDSVKDSIVDKVHRFGCSMLDLGLKPLPLLVDVGISMLQLPGESVDEGIARVMMKMNVWDCVPATKASIGALEEVAFDGLWSVKECGKCSKTLAVGKLARMPCSHVFHRQCIYAWLAGIHMCPICRFTMPC
ncbi:uncharacterized protein LOC131316082 [Rhododendron vialii]|uniref:uncharacterized protein LOC131316082 n=1 Tax=Rhododendron vialii TaxID=182163 RepID=UPI00265F4815|nr:uncharacterized protein LOC131316082 [Rhododendron vialii]